jgi:hypothetical protein
VDGAGRAVVAVPARGGSSVLARSSAGGWRPVIRTRSAFGVGIAADPAGDLVVVAPDLRSRSTTVRRLTAGGGPRPATRLSGAVLDGLLAIGADGTTAVGRAERVDGRLQLVVRVAPGRGRP